MDNIKIEKAIEIEDGKTYVLELDQQLSFEQIAVIQKTWKEASNSKVIVIQAGAKLARVGEDEIREQIAKEIEAWGKSFVGAQGLGAVLNSREAADIFATIARGLK